MATFKKWLNSPFVTVPLIVAFGAIDLVLLGRSYDLSKSDWATWIGSIGTIGTLVGTIALSRSEARRRNEQERALAAVTAAGFVPKIVLLSATLGRCNDSARLELNGSSTADFSGMAKLIESATVWTAAETVPLVVLPGNVAARLAIISSNIDVFHRHLVEASTDPDMRMESSRREFMNSFIPAFEDLRHSLHKALAICEASSNYYEASN